MNCSNQLPCACTYPGCPRHGKCCECVAYHRDHGGRGAGMFLPKKGKRFGNATCDAVLDKGLKK